MIRYDVFYELSHRCKHDFFLVIIFSFTSTGRVDSCYIYPLPKLNLIGKLGYLATDRTSKNYKCTLYYNIWVDIINSRWSTKKRLRCTYTGKGGCIFLFFRKYFIWSNPPPPPTSTQSVLYFGICSPSTQRVLYSGIWPPSTQRVSVFWYLPPPPSTQRVLYSGIWPPAHRGLCILVFDP